MAAKHLTTLLLGAALFSTSAWAERGLPAGSSSAAAATQSDAAVKTVMRDGRRLVFHVIPGTSPAIVLDAGSGEDSSHWDGVARRIAAATGAKVITYDRAGLGASDPASGDWSLESSARDLEAGLRALDETKGVTLVSHSLAGEIATRLAGLHPDWFAGAVFVDASVPGFYTDAMIERQLAAYAPLIAAAKKAPPTPSLRSLLAVARSFGPVSREFHRMRWPTTIPVTVIVSEKTPLPDPNDAQAWRDAQAAFAAEAPNRTLVTAAGSSHDVVHDRPDVVLRAIVDRRGHSAAGTSAAYDLVIRNGRVLDGSGSPWILADVAVKDGRIARIGQVAERGSREIDATGRYVTPGWIDVMDQSGSSLLENGGAESKIRQGVTTAIAGEGGTPGGSADLAAFFGTLEKKGTALNFGTLYGASQARVEVMGDVDGVPTAAQLAMERAHVEEAMKAGAMGIGTALIYAPASYQKTPELVELAKVAHRYGGIYANHMRDEGEKLIEGVRESISIGEQSGIPVEIYHLKAAYAPGWAKFMPEVGRMIEDARSRNVDIAADMYPYTAAGTGLDITVPNWVWAEGREKGLARLADPAVRTTLKKQVLAGPLPGWTNLVQAVGGWSHIVLIDGFSPQYAKYRYKSLEAIGRDLKRDPADVAWDIVLAAGARRPLALYFAMDERDVETALRFPWTSIGSDASATTGSQTPDGHPRAFGTFPRVIAEYVRKRHVLTLEDAVRKMTSWPAIRYRLQDRGLIRAGLRADLTIFDYARIADTATYEAPSSYPQGIDYVVVNGQLVIDGGKPTGLRPGMVLRGQGWTG